MPNLRAATRARVAELPHLGSMLRFAKELVAAKPTSEAVETARYHLQSELDDADCDILAFAQELVACAALGEEAGTEVAALRNALVSCRELFRAAGNPPAVEFVDLSLAKASQAAPAPASGTTDTERMDWLEARPELSVTEVMREIGDDVLIYRKGFSGAPSLRAEIDARMRLAAEEARRDG